MKFRFIAVCSIIIICFVSSFAQERKFEIDVSLENNSIKKNSNKILVKLKVTNKSKDILKTKNLSFIKFYFSKYQVLEKNRKFNDLYYATSSIPSKKLKTNESFEFKINLAKLYWASMMQSNLCTGGCITFKDDVPKDNVYFTAELRVFDGYIDKKKKSPKYKNIRLKTVKVSMK